MKLFVFALVVAVGHTAVAQGAAKDTDALKAKLAAVSDGMMGAAQRKDAVGFAAAFGPGFLEVNPNGVEADTAAITRHVMACTIASFAASDVQLRVVSPATAILAFHQHQAVTCDGHAMPADVNITDTFVQRNGRWLIVLHTETPSAN